jgi:hypothetical protein
MILVSGGFGWNGVKAAINLRELDLSKYDKVITNGLTGFCLSCYKLGKIVGRGGRIVNSEGKTIFNVVPVTGALTIP